MPANDKKNQQEQYVREKIPAHGDIKIDEARGKYGPLEIRR